MHRISLLKDLIEKKRVNSFLITNLKNIRYITGFTGSSAFLFLSKKGDFLFTDFRYKEQSQMEVKSIEALITKSDPVKFITNHIKRLGVKQIAVEDTIIYRLYRRLSKAFSITTLKDEIENIRSIKDKEELLMIKKAVKRAENAFRDIKDYIKKGRTEKSIALRLEEKLKHHGVQALPFDIIFSSGKNTALPHIRPTEKKLSPGDFVMIDWGGEAGGYFSDMTRTFIMNGPGIGKKKEIYNIVFKANRSAFSSIKKEIYINQIDSFTHSFINKAGYGDYFGHATGHGVGLDVHELPVVSKNSKRLKIKENMVFTIEPGIYVPDIGGVRIEDMVVVSGDTAKLLTTLPRKLEIL